MMLSNSNKKVIDNVHRNDVARFFAKDRQCLGILSVKNHTRMQVPDMSPGVEVSIGAQDDFRHFRS